MNEHHLNAFDAIWGILADAKLEYGKLYNHTRLARIEEILWQTEESVQKDLEAMSNEVHHV